MSTITVRRNWKKKIDYICGHVKDVKVFSLSNNFSGGTHQGIDYSNPTAVRDFVVKELNDGPRTKLTYNKENGHCTLHVHSNLWFSWVNKIDW
jgi:hypothetical protein